LPLAQLLLELLVRGRARREHREELCDAHALALVVVELPLDAHHPAEHAPLILALGVDLVDLVVVLARAVVALPHLGAQVVHKGHAPLLLGTVVVWRQRACHLGSVRAIMG